MMLILNVQNDFVVVGSTLVVYHSVDFSSYETFPEISFHVFEAIAYESSDSFSIPIDLLTDFLRGHEWCYHFFCLFICYRNQPESHPRPYYPNGPP